MKTKKRKHARKPRRLARRSYRRNPQGGAFDQHAATELELYIDNDRDLHRQSFTPIIANLVKKMKKGSYTPSLAAKLWAYHIKRGADKYAREFGTRGDTGAKMFNKATRDRMAKEYEEYNRPQIEQEAGYKKNPGRKHARKTRRKSARRVKRNPAPSKASRMARLDRLRKAAYDRYSKTNDRRHEDAYGRITDMFYRAKEGDKNWTKGRPAFRHGAKPTVSQIKRIAEANGSHYFDKATLKFFGNKMSDFKVFRSKRSGRIFIGAPSRTKKGYYSLHEFTGKRLNSVKGSPNHWSDVKDWVDKQY